MKKICYIISLFLGIVFYSTANATNLIQVYQQALISDQLFREAIEQRCSTKQGVPISLAGLLPALIGTITPNINKTEASGSANLTGNYSQKGYTINLALSQTLFDFSKIAQVQGQLAISKEADANLNVALQDLMLRVAKAYFAVLQDLDNLSYVVATKEAFAKQLDQITQQYNVGLKTITDVYTAQASYDSSVANYITAQNRLSNDRENLRVITGIYYPNLAKLSEAFPLISPRPEDMEAWVAAAQRQNWSIRSSQFAACAARQNIKQQFAGALPTLNAQGSYQIQFNRTVASLEDSFIARGTYRAAVRSGSLVLNVPLVQGGLVIATTRKAQFDYGVAVAQLEQQIRTTINTARQSFLNVQSDISRVKADKQTIKSTISSLEGLQASYQVGTETLVNVLGQQQKVFEAQLQYANDRYDYVNQILTLKSAAGILSQCDLQAINSWLIEGKSEDSSYVYNSGLSQHSNKCYCNKNSKRYTKKKTNDEHKIA